MMKNARTLALGGCLAALGTLSAVSAVLAQGPIITPPHNCFCEVPAADACLGVKMTAATTCDYAAGKLCSCRVIRDVENGGCVESLAALCVDAPTP